MKKILFVAMMALIPITAFANGESRAALYNAGNAAYEQGDYRAALENYGKAVEGGFVNPHIEYNIGNAFMKLNPPDLARAVVRYERAKKLEPRDPDTRQNLEYAKGMVKGRLPEIERSFVKRGFLFVVERVTPNEAVGALAALYFILAIIACVYYLTYSERVRRALIKAGIIALALTFVEAPFAVGSLVKSREHRAVVLADDLPARSGAGVENPELFKLFAGMAVEVRESRGNWRYVALPNGLVGWIPADKLEGI